MSKDIEYIAKIEKAVKEKYGEEAIQNPKKYWDKDKEANYLKQIKLFYSYDKKDKKVSQNEGFIIKESKKQEDLNQRECPVCGLYSLLSKDDVYMTKFECCFECYINFVEDREDRWKNGWRPKK